MQLSTAVEHSLYPMSVVFKGDSYYTYENMTLKRAIKCTLGSQMHISSPPLIQKGHL